MSDVLPDLVNITTSPFDEEVRRSRLFTVISGMFVQAELVGVEDLVDASHITRLRMSMPAVDDVEGMDAHLLRFSLEENPALY